jgi:hypothetical protein
MTMITFGVGGERKNAHEEGDVVDVAQTDARAGVDAE